MTFETASACDLKKAGAWRYSEDITTEVLCLGYTLDGTNPIVLRPEDLYKRSPLRDAAEDADCMFVAHNTAFEKAIWRNVMVPVYGWPDIPNERWHDTQAVCAMKGLPLKLERAAIALGLQAQKDMEGSHVTRSLSRPDKRGYFDRSAAKLERVYAYNKLDLVAETGLHKRIRGLGKDERNVWLLDQRINERGVRLDLEFVEAAQSIVDQATVPLAKEFHKLTGGIAPTQRDKFLGWLRTGGCNIPDLRKETIQEWLGQGDEEEDSLAGDVEDGDQEPVVLSGLHKRALEIRQTVGSASIKKLGAMRACVGLDGRARGLLQYHGAGPGRWAGRLLQPQNFPRPSLDAVDGKAPEADALVQAICSKDAEFVNALYGEPINVVVSSLRHALLASEGNQFVVGDFATIEARIVLALAGADRALDIILSGRDIYVEMAQTIFNRPLTKKDNPEERHVGKNTVLGCGFQMGAKKFRARYAKDKPLEFAQQCIRAYREDFAPEVPKLWWALEKAATRCVWDKAPFSAYGVEYRLVDGWLTARLPSGRRLWYYDPQPCRKAMPWDPLDVRPGFTYMAWKMGQWRKIHAYGGLLTENVVQASARDLLVHGLFNCEAAGLPVVLTVHDEAVCDVPAASASAETLDKCLTDAPQWARALKIPVASECWVGSRYRK